MPQKLSMYIQPLLRNAHRKLPNANLEAIKPFKVIQGHRV